MPGLRELLKDNLKPEELDRLKTAFDVIGDIAIIEVDEDMRIHEKLIAKTLLDSHKQINTVLRKDSAHEGEFRTQKMQHLAGEKKKVTMHIESNCRLKLDVEKVYFSPRMAHERLRIAKQIKENENVMVLFSGCGPYPIVLAKNSKARQVLGIEMNPDGHRYAVVNVQLNKLKNTFVYQGDARTVVHRLKNRSIGLKTHYKQLESRMKLKPQLLELHLFPDDIDGDDLDNCLKDLTKKTKVVLHAPMQKNGMPLTLATDDKKIIKNTVKIQERMRYYCEKYKLRYVMHADQRYEDSTHKISMKVLEKNLKKYKDKYMLIENTPFVETGQNIFPITRKFDIKLCLDTSHLYLTRKDDDDFYAKIQELSEQTPYFHIIDADQYRFSFDKSHSLPIGDGEIDFSRIVPYIDEGIIEVISKDETKGTEMIESYKKYNKMLDKFIDFDRIVMPMPKGGEDFLDVALSAAGKGTIIHFYDFLHVDEFDLAKEKVKKACKKAGKKFKFLDLVKCGSQSPRTYRICLDFELL